MIEFECCRCDQKADAESLDELLNHDEWPWHKTDDGLLCFHCWEDLHPGRIRSFMEKHDKQRKEG